METRLFVEKKTSFNTESQRVLKELQGIAPISSLKIYQIYDIYGIEKGQLAEGIANVITNPVTDIIHHQNPVTDNYIAVEYLPGQYDQRADSTEQCLQLLGINVTKVTTGQLFAFEDVLTEQQVNDLKAYLINPIEKREQDLSILELDETTVIKPVPTIDGFMNFQDKELVQLHKDFGFSMGMDDLVFIQDHFKSIDRNPTETELKVLDTYWSDHCRHTTFETEITDIKIESQFKDTIQKTLDYYLGLRNEMGITKPVRLMDMATIMGKYLSKNGTMDNIEVSEEVNACSIVIKVDHNNVEEEWLLMFKNETHNHPTEVDPYGGASTCVGGAIRDPLSGRSYVFQAMRVTGSANPLEKIEDTLEGKLPQRKITKQAAKGYSGYGNQIGLATTQVREIYHQGYKAKRLEVGFVAGAVKRELVRRETPAKGDIIILLGGQTGRDGVGGATGSSKVHDGQKLVDLSAEVQKGNAPTERKIQRLFRKDEVVKMIKKCNDFGAGGVAVAIGEISDGVKINLDEVAVKYNGLNGTELAISESQERMAVVVEPHNVEAFIKIADSENLEAKIVAEVTDDNTMTLLWKGQKIVELDRAFLDTNGVRKQTVIASVNEEKQHPFNTVEFNEDNFLALLKDLNHTSQKGLIEMFDSVVGRGTILMPMGGVHQETMEDVSVQKIPTLGFTNTVSMASWGFEPKISQWSCYHGGYYAVIDSVTKLVAAGAKYQDIRLTFQEYFEKLRNEPQRWAKPFEALLGTIEIQKELGIAAIGGKDSMSGSYENIDVPPTLISFAVAPSKVKQIKTATLAAQNANLYLVHSPMNEEHLLDMNSVRSIYTQITALAPKDTTLAMAAVKFGGIAETLNNMAAGNRVGFQVNTALDVMAYLPAGVLVQTTEVLEGEFVTKLGETNTESKYVINNVSIAQEEVLKVFKSTLESVFPSKTSLENTVLAELEAKNTTSDLDPTKVETPKVVIPVFPGTNSEYDSAKAFIEEGAEVEQIIIKNLNSENIKASVIEFSKAIDAANILFIPGGFSAADEPEGSGKFIATVLKNPQVKASIHALLKRDGLILGICNGFQALVKSGLLPYGEIRTLDESCPTLFYNNIGRHIAQQVRVKIESNATFSPWLKDMANETYWIPVSHGEGKFMASEELLNDLIANNQIAGRYVNLDNQPTMESPFNPNGSTLAIEGLVSKCGKIYGRMGHPERTETGLYKNIPGSSYQNIFKNAVEYFTK